MQAGRAARGRCPHCGRPKMFWNYAVGTMTCPVCPMMEQAASYRPDLYYVQTRFRSRTGRTILHRERVVSAWRYFLLYRWQVFRFRSMQGLSVLVQRDSWPVLYEDVADPSPRHVPGMTVTSGPYDRIDVGETNAPVPPAA